MWGPCRCPGSALVAASGAPHCGGFSGCRARTSRARRLQQLWHTGFVALRLVESSQIRGQTRASCTGRQKLDLWATRESLPPFPLSFLLVNASWIPGSAELPSQWALVLGESHRCFQGCRAHPGLFTGLPTTDPLGPILFSLFSL